MKTFFKLLIGIVVLALIFVAVLYFFFVSKQTIEQPTTGDTTSGFGTAVGGTKPGGTATGSGATSTQNLPEGKRYVLGRGGERIVVNDFLTGTTASTSEYIGDYYSFPVGNATSAPFRITYTAKDQFFQVTINDNPLGGVRQQAERYLITMLGIEQKTACFLKHSVGVPNWRSTTYSGKNLEFSFCSNAVLLPEI